MVPCSSRGEDHTSATSRLLGLRPPFARHDAAVMALVRKVSLTNAIQLCPVICNEHIDALAPDHSELECQLLLLAAVALV